MFIYLVFNNSTIKTGGTHSGFRISNHTSFIVNSNHIVSESYTKIPTKGVLKNENCQFLTKSEDFHSIEKKVYLRSNRTP